MTNDPGFGKKPMHIFYEGAAAYVATHVEFGQVYTLPKELLKPTIIWRFFREQEDNVVAVLNLVISFVYLFFLNFFLNFLF